ncbi:uncharacterized protein LOC127809769 isoform X3 [Diospyros lotus]|uniref:uncharacterized protein LOC127809769 isoform X3 n=1 Tax=Diospyros lotus TaxID=55363 RepID=UPI00225B1E14|nr:uncharacterized protein LOC127809769 isoform X3 [Diospyros lotus]
MTHKPAITHSNKSTQFPVIFNRRPSHTSHRTEHHFPAQYIFIVICDVSLASPLHSTPYLFSAQLGFRRSSGSKWKLRSLSCSAKPSAPTAPPSVSPPTPSTASLSSPLSPSPFYPSPPVGSGDPGVVIAAATYLKNFTRRSVQSSKVSKEFRDELVRALLQVDSAVLKVLVEAFRVIVASEFVKENSWPDLVPNLRAAIMSSDLIDQSGNCEWKTINALTLLQSLIRPFQYFLNPKVAKEPIPTQLELIAQEIIAPLLDIFHQHVGKALTISGNRQEGNEKLLLILCKCMYFAVRSHMPSALAPHFSSFCGDLFHILNSLSFNGATSLEEGYLLRLKTGKRSLLIFCAIVTQHRKLSDKLMPSIIDCVVKIVKHSTNISRLDFLSERIVSLAFDVISRVLESGPGWRLVSPHFSSLLDSAVFPALVMNEKDITEWEEDPEEYMRKNLPSELEEISGWKEDLFTARKSALNLLGVISMSKGPPGGSRYNSSLSSKRKKSDKSKGKDHSLMGELLVLPFLSKFPIPSGFNAHETKALNEYFGVLMAYGSLQDFLSKQKTEYIATIVRTRVLPLYKISLSSPYLVASANWVLGELASCLPEEMRADVYSSLLTALTMPDMGHISCYPVRVSAVGAIAELIENDYLPPEWLPLLQVVVGRIADECEEASILFQLLSTLFEAGNEHVTLHTPNILLSLVGTISKSIPRYTEPWPQIVERGFSALAVMAQCWEDSMPEEGEQSASSEVWVSGRAVIARALSGLLQQAWLGAAQQLEEETASLLPSPSCIEDSSACLRFIIQSVTSSNEVLMLKVSELALVWADLIASWNAWEETEDLSIFNCIKDIISLHQRYLLQNFFMAEMPPPPAPPVRRRSTIEGIGAFITDAFSQYSSATWRASSCAHIVLHLPNYTFDAEGVKQSLVIAFTHAAFSRFRNVRSKPCSLWTPLLLAVSSCYLCYPDVVEKILEKDEHEGFAVWASSLSLITFSTFEYTLSSEAEIKLSEHHGFELGKEPLCKQSDDISKNC